FSAAHMYSKVLILVPSLFFKFGERRLNAARYIVELEILMPAEPEQSADDVYDKPKPSRTEHDKEEFAKLLKEWQREKDKFAELLKDEWQQKEDERRKEIARLLRKHFSERRLEFWGWLWRNIKSLALGQGEPPKAKTGTLVPVGDFPSLDDARSAIKRYFDALKSIDEDGRSFLSRVEIDVGYLAPLFLVTGLINRFADEDGWTLILRNYRGLVEGDTQYSVELRELRSFLFNCWLLWGPSVSSCSCKAWIAEDHPESLTIQYGYGDENNSIDVTIRNGRGFNFMNVFKSRLAKLPDRDATEFTPVSIYAAPYKVIGRFKWGPHLPEGEISPAQKLIQGGTLGRRKPLSGRIMLECDDNNVSLIDTEQSAKYYSAYIWVMFVIEDGEGNLFFPHQPWKNLLPFFEHGNIADATTFLTLKECLIAKVASALTEILERAPNPGEASVSIRYVCALDDSNCSAPGSVLFPTHRGVGQGSAAGPKPERLIDILKKTVSSVQSLSAAHGAGRLQLPSEGGSEADHDFASCDLPAIVEGFYQDLKSQGDSPSCSQGNL
ncbi:MAG: hypothetical protein ACLPJW_18295, partial [Rhodomicrobium sp.]